MSAPWALWRALVQEGRINSLERAFAESLGAYEPNSFRFCQTPCASRSESYALLLVYLLKASLEGHMCIQIDERGHFTPNLEGWNGATDLRWRATRANWRAAFKTWSEHIPIASGVTQRETPFPIIKQGTRIYLQRQLALETSLRDLFFQMEREIADLQIDQDLIEKELSRLTTNSIVLPEQAQAIAVSSGRARLTCLVGGPGTGKTFTAGHFIALFARCCKKAPRIALTAPTGRAAANLQRISRGMSNLPKSLEISAATLHTLLGIFKSPDRARFHQLYPLPHDVILVDESSMIDARLMSALLRAVKPGARLLLMGDADQLPPVELGSPFSDYLTHSARHRPYHMTRLGKCMRTEIQPIVDLAASVRVGDVAGVLDKLANCEGVSWQPLNSSDDWRAARKCILERARRLSGAQTLLEALKLFEKSKILSPLKIGPWGAEQLNEEVYRGEREHSPAGEFLPLLITSNNSDLELFNGDQGVLSLTSKARSTSITWRERGQSAHFACAEGMRSLPAALLPDCDLAWALSIHKAQGSEFEEIDLVIPPGCEHISRQLLYTALTRARRCIRVWSSPVDLEKAIGSSQERLSGLVERLALENERESQVKFGS